MASETSQAAGPTRPEDAGFSKRFATLTAALFGRARSVVQAIAVLLLPMVSSAREAPIEVADWAIYRTPHFEVMTTQPEEEIGALIEDISLFRSVVIALLGEGAEELGSSTVRFLVLDHPGDVQFLFGSAPGVTGFTRPSLSGDLMVVGRPPARRTFALGNQVVFHEYVHQLVQMRSHSRHPAWYAEGIADFLSTLERRKDRIVLGDMPESRKLSVRREPSMSLRDVLETVSTWSLPEDRRSSFYAQSWLLVHHLLLAEDREELGFARSLATSLDAYDRGEPSLEAFTSSFSVSLHEFPRRLERHLRRLPTMEYPLAAFRYQTRYERQVLTPRERTLLLARYTRESNPDEALRMLQTLGAGGGEDAEVLAAIAVTLAWLNQREQAIAAIEKARSLHDTAFMVWLEAGRAWRHLCSRDADRCIERGDHQASGKAFARAYALNPDDVEARTRYAQYLLQTPERGEALPLLAASLAAAPWSFEVLHSMAVAYLARGRFDLARNYLEKAQGWAVDHPDLQADVSRLLLQIERLDPAADE